MKKTITTVKEYNDEGKLIKETITETTDNDLNRTQPFVPYNEPLKPHTPNWWETITVRWNAAV